MTMNRLKQLFLALCLWPLLAFGAEQTAQSVTIHIEGMTCSLCVTAINKALRSLPEVEKAKAEIEKTGYQGTIRSVAPVPAGSKS